MKFEKFFSIFLVCALLFSGVANAAVTVEKDGVKRTVEYIDFVGEETVTFPSNDRAQVDAANSTLTDSRGDDAVLVMASSSTVITDLSLPYSVIVKYVGGGGGIDSLGSGTILPDAPRDGQCISMIIAGLQSGGSWKITPTTKTGFTSISMDTKSDTCTLCYANDSIGWYVDANGGSVINQA